MTKSRKERRSPTRRVDVHRGERAGSETGAPELREDVTPYRVGQRVPPVSISGGELPASEMIGDSRDACPTFIDLFCGIGGFRLAFERAGCQCVFSSDWNKYAQQTYAANSGETPHGDIHSVAVADIPAHDILCAGFPRQPFSIATAF